MFSSFLNSLSSKQLAHISIASSVLLILLCLIPATATDKNLVLLFAVSLVAGIEARKRRKKEVEDTSVTMPPSSDAYEGLPPYRDLYLAIALSIISGGMFIAHLSPDIFGFSSSTLSAWYISLGLLVCFVSLSIAISGSMLPAIASMDVVIYERWLFFPRQPKRGDIVYFPSPPRLKIEGFSPTVKKLSSQSVLGIAICKRVIALPGETIRVIDGGVFINDKRLEENGPVPATYELNTLGDIGYKSFRPYSDPDHRDKPITVPSNHYFLLGDLRINQDIDSHVFGFVPQEQIYGRVIAVIPTLSRLFPNKANAYLHRAASLSELGRFEEALADCDHAVTIAPKTINCYLQRAMTLRDLKLYDRALEDCEYAIKLVPGYGAAYIARASVKLHMKCYQEALQDCDTAERFRQKGSDLWLIRAQANLFLGNYQLAYDFCKRALALKPQDINVLSSLGAACIGLGRWPESVENLDKAIGLGSKYPPDFSDRAKARYELGLYDECLSDCNLAIELDRSLPTVYKHRARVYLVKSQPEAALIDINRAIELDSNCADYYEFRSTAYAALGQEQMAQDDRQKARSILANSVEK